MALRMEPESNKKISNSSLQFPAEPHMTASSYFDDQAIDNLLHSEDDPEIALSPFLSVRKSFASKLGILIQRRRSQLPSELLIHDLRNGISTSPLSHDKDWNFSDDESTERTSPPASTPTPEVQTTKPLSNEGLRRRTLPAKPNTALPSESPDQSEPETLSTGTSVVQSLLSGTSTPALTPDEEYWHFSDGDIEDTSPKIVISPDSPPLPEVQAAETLSKLEIRKRKIPPKANVAQRLEPSQVSARTYELKGSGAKIPLKNSPYAESDFNVEMSPASVSTDDILLASYVTERISPDVVVHSISSPPLDDRAVTLPIPRLQNRTKIGAHIPANSSLSVLPDKTAELDSNISSSSAELSSSKVGKTPDTTSSPFVFPGKTVVEPKKSSLSSSAEPSYFTQAKTSLKSSAYADSEIKVEKLPTSVSSDNHVVTRHNAETISSNVIHSISPPPLGDRGITPTVVGPQNRPKLGTKIPAQSSPLVLQNNTSVEAASKRTTLSSSAVPSSLTVGKTPDTTTATRISGKSPASAALPSKTNKTVIEHGLKMASSSPSSSAELSSLKVGKTPEVTRIPEKSSSSALPDKIVVEPRSKMASPSSFAELSSHKVGKTPEIKSTNRILIPEKSSASALPKKTVVEPNPKKSSSSTSISSAERTSLKVGKTPELSSVKATSNAHHDKKPTRSDEFILSFPTTDLNNVTAPTLEPKRHPVTERSVPGLPVEKNDPKPSKPSIVTPATPSKWKTINLDTLDTLLMSEEGFKTIARLKGEDAVTVVDFIDKILDNTQLMPDQRKRYSAVLRKLCGHAAILPTSHTLTDDLKIVGQLPKAGGGFAEVWEGTCKERSVAIKVLRTYVTGDVLKVKKRFCKEALIWKRFSHLNVLPFLGVATSPFQFCMVSPWMPNGNVSEYVAANPRADRFLIIWDIASGLSYLHDLGVVHGDLKGPNIMISSQHRACLADFGLTTIAADKIPGYSMSAADSKGTIRWMAPELLIPEEYGLETCVPTKESDIYAFGMVIYEITTGNIPFSQYMDAAVLSKVTNGARPERPTDPATLNLVNAVWSLAEECWRQQPNERPPIAQVLERLGQENRNWHWNPPEPPTVAAEPPKQESEDSDDSDWGLSPS